MFPTCCDLPAKISSPRGEALAVEINSRGGGPWTQMLHCPFRDVSPIGNWCASMPCSHLYRRADLTGTTEEDKFSGEMEPGIGPIFSHFWVLVA